MYDELIKNLRENMKDGCADCTETTPIILQAADAIEELSKAFDVATAGYARENHKRILAEEKVKKSEVDNINLTGWLAEEHAKHQWIPVSERLPEKYDRVFVYSKATRMGRSIDFINADGNWYTTPKVTHWMPLPEPPKDGEA